MTGIKKQIQLAVTNREDKKMKLMEIFNYHSHYWGIPYPRTMDNRLVQTCYECGAEREVKIELRPQADENVTVPVRGGQIAA
jgi:hypothetical protein